MIIHDVEQGTPEWKALRFGIPTASEFEKILSNGGKISTQQDDYQDRMIFEAMAQEADEAYQSEWMQRGNEVEEEAASYYALKNRVEVRKVGFVTDDARTMGASPDRLVDPDGLLEIKCPSGKVMIKYAMDKTALVKKYFTQCQGELLVTDRKWVDIIAYHPRVPSIIVRIPRDEPFLTSLRRELSKFHEGLEAKRKLLTESGYLQ